MTRLLSNTPDGPSDGLPPVTVCAAVSTFIQFTVSPALIVISAGMKHELLFSHPGVEVPAGMSTLCVVGPTGSGKTTTLYACLNELNHPGVNIITVEDQSRFELKE